MATLQAIHTIPDPSYTWEGITNVEYECSYDAETNQTTVMFSEGYFRYYGLSNYVTDSTASIMVAAVDNEASTASATMTFDGTTNGGNSFKYVTPSPVSVTVQHSPDVGEKSIVISVDSTISCYITQSGKSSINAKASDVVVVGECEEQGLLHIFRGYDETTNGPIYDTYYVYIYNGVSWDKYIPYIYNGTSWDLYS